MPRRKVLTEEDVAGLLALPKSETDLARHWTLSDFDIALIQRRRGNDNRLGFGMQLCAYRYPGRLLRPGEVISHETIAFVGDQLGIAADALASYAARRQTRRDQLGDLRDAFGYQAFSPEIRREMVAWLLPVALATTDGVRVATAFLDELRRRRVLVPGSTIIERIVAAAMLGAERIVARQLTAGLSDDQLAHLDDLLTIRDGTRLSSIAWARQPPGAPGHRAISRVLDQREHLLSLDLDPAVAEGVHPERLRQLAREGARLTAQHLAALSVSRRRAVLVATVLDTAVRLTDDAVGLFDRLMGRVFLRAERREEAALIRDRRAINDKVRLLARLGDALIAAKDSGSDPIAAVGRVIAWEDLAASIAEAKRLVRTDGPDRAAIVARGHAVVRAVGQRLFDSLTFRSLPASARVLAGIETLRGYYASGRRSWPKDAALGFVPRSWRATVVTKDGIDRRAYEVCLFDELRGRLRAGDVWVEGSRQYRAVEDQLLPKALFAAMREAGPLPVAVSGTARDYLEKRRALLARRMDEVASKAVRGKLEGVRIEGGVLKITPLGPAAPEAAEAAAEVLYRTLPAVRITDLMADVDRWTGFSETFTHLHTGLPADERRIVMTAVLADATNLGLTRMADACTVASYRQLSWTTGWHLREETYRRALARIVDGQQAQPLARLFGAGSSSSSDGQHFHVGGPGEAVGAVNRHHGREPTVGFYTHVTDRYAPFHTAVLTGSAGEAAHVIDGLLYHEADLDLAVHHTDGGGVSDHVFGLAHILGFRFAPRIPNIGDRKLHAMDKPERWPALGSLIGGGIDEDLIEGHWDDVLRLATSVRTGTVSASLMLKRLGAYPRQNGLALALREIGRIERTLFTLDWLEDPQLRRASTVELNKGESRNALARAVCFHRLGRIRDRSREGQQHRASGLALLTAAIVLWNTVYLDRALTAMTKAGRRVDDALLPHIAPLGWQHINLTGDYLWSETPPLDDDGYRQLRRFNVLETRAA